jgi:hypothetical protein
MASQEGTLRLCSRILNEGLNSHHGGRGVHGDTQGPAVYVKSASASPCWISRRMRRASPVVPQLTVDAT